MKNRIIKKTGLLLLLTLLGMRNIKAQDTTARTITLKEAINLSITNSKLLKNNKAKIDEATAAVDEAKERKLPDFSVTGSYLYLPVNPDISLKSDTSSKGGGFPKVHQAMYG